MSAVATDKKKRFFLCSFPLLLAALAACSFDYGTQTSGGSDQPNIVMDNVEYVRVRSDNLQARFQAERLERFEERRVMELRNFTFEQFDSGEEINAQGRAGNASFEIDTGDIRMGNTVRLDIESEDIAIETAQLEWRDGAKTLTSGAEDEVNIFQENGTSFSGVGFRADARQRTWEFSGTVGGTYIHDDEETENEVEATETGDADAP